jgi:hypothetical protein
VRLSSAEYDLAKKIRDLAGSGSTTLLYSTGTLYGIIMCPLFIPNILGYVVLLFSQSIFRSLGPADNLAFSHKLVGENLVRAGTPKNLPN